MYFTWNLGASPLSTCTHLDNVFSSAQLFSNRGLQCSWGSPTPFTTIPHTDHQEHCSPFPRPPHLFSSKAMGPITITTEILIFSFLKNIFVFFCKCHFYLLRTTETELFPEGLLFLTTDGGGGVANALLDRFSLTSFILKFRSSLYLPLSGIGPSLNSSVLCLPFEILIFYVVPTLNNSKFQNVPDPILSLDLHPCCCLWVDWT